MQVEARRTCSIVWLETPTERALLLGSLVMAIGGGRVSACDCNGVNRAYLPFQVSTMETSSSMITSPPSTELLATRGK